MNEREIDVLRGALEKNEVIMTILNRALSMKLSNWYLGAGCIAQTVWNEQHGFPPAAYIKDYDLVYFDSTNLSYEAEDWYIKKGTGIFQDLGVQVEIRNQARVHLWSQTHFGYAIKPYLSVEEAIASWSTTATSIGIRLEQDMRFVVYAPYGLEDLFAMVVRPNKKQITKEIYMEKVGRWIKLWPKLRVIPWE